MYQEEISNKYKFTTLNSSIQFYFMTLLCLSLACSTANASLIDAKYKLSRRLSLSGSHKSTNEISTLYKDFLSKSMYSKCRWFPSDSQYLAISSQKCGRTRGTLLAFSRFMTESDADKISEGIVNDDGHIRFLGFGDNCELL